jgi:hypothetical protein
MVGAARNIQKGAANMTIGRRLFAVLGAVALVGAGVVAGAASASKPKTVLHIITLKWKDGVTDAQKKTVMDGIEKMAADPKVGIKNVWLKTLKVQGEGYSNVFVMEFKDKAAFDAYGDAPAHKEWEKIYLPLRGQSTTHDATNE